MNRVLLLLFFALGLLGSVIGWLRVWSIFGDGPWPPHWSGGAKLAGLIIWVVLLIPMAGCALMVRTGVAHFAAKFLGLPDWDALDDHPGPVAAILRWIANAVGILWMLPAWPVLAWLGSSAGGGG